MVGNSYSKPEKYIRHKRWYLSISLYHRCHITSRRNVDSYVESLMSLVLYTNVYHAFFQISNGNIYVHVYINRGPGTFIAITAWGCAERSYLSVGRWRIHESANQPVINADNGLSTAQRQAMFSPDVVLLVHVHALTHWDRVTHLCVSKKKSLVQKMACRQFGSNPLSRHMLEYCKFKTQELTWNLNRNSYIFIK